MYNLSKEDEDAVRRGDKVLVDLDPSYIGDIGYNIGTPMIALPKLAPEDKIYGVVFNKRVQELERENRNLQGHIRRLEKSNQELGEELHRCQHPGEAKGWD